MLCAVDWTFPWAFEGVTTPEPVFFPEPMPSRPGRPRPPSVFVFTRPSVPAHGRYMTAEGPVDSTPAAVSCDVYALPPRGPATTTRPLRAWPTITCSPLFTPRTGLSSVTYR